MIAPFTYAAAPARVVFGPGRLAELPGELDRLGIRRALLLTTPEQAPLAARAAELAGPRAGGAFDGATMHTPTAVTETALLHVEQLGCDGLVALGGGSTIGLSKALALRTGLPQVAVPTTYAGSEMTPILGETADGRKVTQRSSKVLPNTVIYDAELTLSLPPLLSAVSGMNALAHAVEALYAREANPVTSLMAEEGIRALVSNLPGLAAAPADLIVRTGALYGAWLCGTCLGAVGMALHHKVCHVLGGTFGLQHAQTHAAVLPHIAGYNAPAAPEAMGRVARALGVPDAPGGLFALARQLGTPAGLRELGMSEDGIEPTIRELMADAYWNPRPPEPDALRAMLRRAWLGEPPGEH